MTTLDVVKFVNKYHGVPFVWGKCDCAVFILDYLKDVAGQDHNYSIKCSWKTKAQAIKFAKKNSGVLEAIKSKVDGQIIENCNLAKTGDIVVTSYNGWSTAGVMVNAKVAFFVEGVGLKILPFCKDEVDLIVRVL